MKNFRRWNKVSAHENYLTLSRGILTDRQFTFNVLLNNLSLNKRLCYEIKSDVTCMFLLDTLWKSLQVLSTALYRATENFPDFLHSISIYSLLIFVNSSTVLSNMSDSANYCMSEIAQLAFTTIVWQYALEYFMIVSNFEFQICEHSRNFRSSNLIFYHRSSVEFSKLCSANCH